MYTYIVAKVKYSSRNHANNEYEDDETSHIQKICFVTNDVKKILETIKIYPFEDDIYFNISEQELTRYFDEARQYIIDDKMDPIYQEIGVYYEDNVAQYFICVIQIPSL